MARNWGTGRMLSMRSSVSFLAFSPSVSARSLGVDSLPVSSTRLRSRSIISVVRRLILTWAKYRRRFGGGEQERSTPSWFLSEVPAELIAEMGVRDEAGEITMQAERYGVRTVVRRNTFTGKTYNSVENIPQFFGERGLPFNAANKPIAAPQRPPGPIAPKLPPPPGPMGAPVSGAARPAAAPPGPIGPPAPRRIRAGMMVEHPKY